MDDIPDAMLKKDRSEDPKFVANEHLYRRFRIEDLDGEAISIDAVELPDMSVIREKYGNPEWLLIQEEFRDWGVFAFQVEDIPRELIHNGTMKFVFEPKHRPLKYNYPHSEIWAYLDGEHIDAKNSDLLLDPGAHQRWRQQLLWRCRTVIRPQK